MASDMRDLLTMGLQDTHSAETRLLAALPAMREAAADPKLKQAFGEHLTITQCQVRRLEQVCQQPGIEPEGHACEAMEGLVEESEEIIDEIDEGPVLDVALTGAAQEVEHYEMASYGTPVSLLKAMGRPRPPGRCRRRRRPTRCWPSWPRWG
ncbi:DUF892 family protein [Dankookia sp. GCM10030260]|uniref:DUF892 family protein n=1 Tax=Dankookia sp. GCM10030260 TaxID=3273390 RepID=UPI003612E3A3